MKNSFVFYNGQIQKQSEPAVRATDGGLLHGLGIYETIAVVNGKPIFLSDHLERMEQGRKFLRIPISPWPLKESVQSFLRETEVQNAALRITMTRGTDGPGSVLFTLRELAPPEGDVQLALSRFIKNPKDPWEGFKTTCRARNIMAREEASEKGCFDAVFKTLDGDFAEGSICNFFIVSEGAIWTPPLNRGILAGVTREKILHLCKDGGIPWEEKPIYPEDLEKAQGVFISNVLIGVLPVTSVLEAWKEPVSQPGRALMNDLQSRYIQLRDNYVKG